MKINTKIKRQYPVLFPGYQLDCPLGHVQSYKVFIGNVFEVLSARLMGGEVTTMDCRKECNPDIVNKSDKFLGESKATNHVSELKLRHDQITKYEKADEMGWDVFYIIWTYEQFQLNKQCKTRREMLHKIVDSIAFVEVLDVKVVSALIKNTDEIEGLKTYIGNRWSRFGPLTLVKPAFMKSLRMNSLAPLHKLYKGTYLVEVDEKQIDFKFNGVEFKTPVFNYTRIKKL